MDPCAYKEFKDVFHLHMCAKSGHILEFLSLPTLSTEPTKSLHFLHICHCVLAQFFGAYRAEGTCELPQKK